MTSCWQHIKTCTFSCCIVLSLLFATPLYAQATIPLDSLLFEAYSLQENLPSVPTPASESASQVVPYLFPGADKAAAEASIDLYLKNITATEADEGPFAPALLEQYLSLGKAYQQKVQHEEAIEVLEKAEYISRINSGLFAADQFVIIENLIASYLATGEQQKAAEKHHYLLFLNQQNFGEDSLQAVPVLQKLGDWQMASFSSNINADVPFTLSFSSGGSRSRQPTPRELAFSNLYLAQNTYFQAIQNLVRNNQLNNPALQELELKLIEAVFFAANRQGMLSNPDFYMDPRLQSTGSRIVRRNLGGNTVGFINGRNAYMRLRIYEEHRLLLDPVAVAQAIIGLGDWHLLFNRRTSAIRHYEEADAYLRNHNVSEDVITEMLHPELPQQLPAFTPLPHSRGKYALADDAPLKFSGYVDVSFDLTRFGNVRNLDISSTSADFPRTTERRLARLLRTTPFRPRLQEGKVVTSDNIKVRYYYADVRTANPAP